MSKAVIFDTLSDLLRRLKFSAKVFLRADYCGVWAVNTAGEQRLPFHFVVSGEGWLHLADKPPQRLNAGHLVMFPTDQEHLLSSSRTPPDSAIINKDPPDKLRGQVTRLVCGYFELEKSAAGPFLASLPNVLSLNLNSESGMATIAQVWLEEAADEKMGGEIAVDLCAQLLFIQLLRSSTFTLRGVLAALTDAKLGSVIARIHAQPSYDFTNRELAAMANMSESTLLNSFKRILGMTPGQYVRHWRMHAAADLLRDSTRSITDITQASGYSSEVSFRKAFRQFFATPPAQFRREAKRLSTQQLNDSSPTQS